MVKTQHSAAPENRSGECPDISLARINLRIDRLGLGPKLTPDGAKRIARQVGRATFLHRLRATETSDEARVRVGRWLDQSRQRSETAYTHAQATDR